jgi:perosamine synthetase
MTDGFNAHDVLRALKSVLSAGADADYVSLHEPNFSGNEWNYVKACLDSGWVSSVGKYVDEFKKTGRLHRC